MWRPLACLLLLARVAAAASSELPSHAGLYLPAPAGTAPAALAMVDSRVEVDVRGAIATVVIHQTFRNDADHVTEATYIFPLPEDAAVTAMAITSGARTIHAAIAARADAQKRYEDAVSAGVGAALLEEERPDVFTQTVSAIAAHGTVEVALRYDTVARPRGDGSWELALPMVVAPRYVPGTASGRPTTGAGHAPDTDRAPDASRVTPGSKPEAGGATAVELVFEDGVDVVTSPTHELAAHGRGYAFTDAHSDRDALIRWRGKAPDGGWVEQDDDGGYAAVIVSAPQAKARAAGGAALDVGLVLDRSAAAHGDADATERPLVRELLADLTQADAVTVTGSATIARAAPIDAWRELDRGWATSPGAFDLTRALRATHGAALVLVTPGLVADDAAALAAARALRTPIHVVGVGPAPNRALLVAIARETGGTIRFVAPDDDAAAIARDLVADLAAPPPALAISWGTLAATDVVPATLPRLGAGQARLVLARVQRAQAANGRARGDVFAIAMVGKEPAIPGELTARGPLARRWARDKLGELLAESSARPNVAAVTAHALRYGLVSPYTSMVAIGDEVVVRGGVKHTVSVPVSVPAGMRWQPLERELHVVTKTEEVAVDGKPAGKRGKDVAGGGGAKKGHGGGKPAPNADPDRDGDVADDRRATRKHPPVVAKSPAPVVQPAPPQAPPAASAGATGAVAPTESPAASDASADSDDEQAAPRVAAELGREATDVSVEGVATPARAYRLALALGGGLTLTDPHGLAALTARVEARRARVGAEAALWLVGGLHAQGRLLATLAWRVQRFELGVGAGVHVTGSAVGPAWSLVLRRDVTRHVAAYLRYDGAELFGDGAHAAAHAISAGAEWRW